MDHDAVRAALAGDDAVPAEARAHVAACDACASFARGLDRVRRAAPLLVPPGPPEGLADRIVATLPAAPPAASPVVVPLRRSFGRRALVRVAAGVAATLLVGATAAVLREDERSPETVLAAAAEKTQSAGTAKVAVTGTATFTLPTDTKRTPEFGTLPVELQARVEAQWQRALASFEQAMREYERQVEAALGRLDDVLGSLPIPGYTRPPRPPRPTGVPTPPPPPPPPARLTTTVRLAASGDVAFGDRLRLAGTVGVDENASFDLVAGREGVAVRAGGGWSVAAAQVGPWAAVASGPDAVVRLVAEATGVEQVAEGRYAFRATAPDGTALAGEAEIGAEGRLSAVRLTASGRTGGLVGASWETDLRVVLSQPGAAVGEGPVRVAEVRDRAPAPDAASRVIYPLGPGVRAAVRARP